MMMMMMMMDVDGDGDGPVAEVGPDSGPVFMLDADTHGVADSGAYMVAGDPDADPAIPFEAFKVMDDDGNPATTDDISIGAKDTGFIPASFTPESAGQPIGNFDAGTFIPAEEPGDGDGYTGPSGDIYDFVEEDEVGVTGKYLVTADGDAYRITGDGNEDGLGLYAVSVDADDDFTGVVELDPDDVIGSVDASGVINITEPSNVPPEFISGDLETVTIDENEPLDTVIYEAEALDDDDDAVTFTIDQTNFSR